MTVGPASLFPFGPRLGFATNSLDRLSAQRDDVAVMASLRRDPRSLTLVLAGEQVLLTPQSGPWFLLAEAETLAPHQHTALLGRRSDGLALFGTALDADRPLEGLEAGGRQLKDLRGLAVEGIMPPEDLGALAQAKALFHWHRHHGFCANCGAATVTESVGWRRSCPQCATLHFPRTDPVVIMMAVDGDRCLLGRQPRFPPGMYSCLAGFVEPGETIENAVRREIGEEAGITTGAVRYLGSQPWPFPASIMIGCVAEATSTTIEIDPDELEDARWFSREETLALLDGRHPGGLLCPAPMAIAHHLMRAWADGTAALPQRMTA